MARALFLSTPYGDKYYVHANGDIERTDIHGFETSGNWKLLGIEHVKSSKFIPLSELLADGIPAQLSWKNGNPQWTVRDLDHGTTRTWGNTKYHGIRSLSKIGG